MWSSSSTLRIASRLYKGRVVVSRNNRLEAVILPIEEYEGIVEDLEHLLTALDIQERKARSRGKRVSWAKKITIS